MKRPVIILIVLSVVFAVLIAVIIVISTPKGETVIYSEDSTTATDTQTDTAAWQTVSENEPEEEEKVNADSPKRSVFSDEELALIEELIFTKADGKDTEELLSRLEEISPDAKAAWKEILAYWDESRQNGFVNTAETGGEPISLMEGCPLEDRHEGTLLPEGLPQDDSLCIICLGFQLYPDGRMQDELIGRLEVARACAMQYPNAFILLTGGPTAFQDRSLTEADAMAQWLIENGVEEERVIIENRSMTSAANALFSYELLHEGYPQVKDIAIVTSDYHIPLGSQLFQAQFVMARELGVETELNVVANASYRVDMNEMFGSDIEANWLWILVREQVAEIHNIEGEM